MLGSGEPGLLQFDEATHVVACMAGGQINRIARQLQPGGATAEHAGECLRMAGLDGADLPVRSADRGLVVDAHLLGQPPRQPASAGPLPPTDGARPEPD